MALTIGVRNVISKGMGGIKFRIVTITFDAAYVAATGYTLTAANCKLRKILGSSGCNLNGYQISVVLSGTGAVLKAYKGNTNSSDNEAGLNTLVGILTVWGY